MSCLRFPRSQSTLVPLPIMILPFIIPSLLAALLAFPVAGRADETESQHHFYVSPTGNDAWSGTHPDRVAERPDGPFATLERARDAARALEPRPERGIEIVLRGGLYWRDATFELTAADSGSERGPVRYRSYPGETPRLVGGAQLSAFMPVTDQAVLERLPHAARGQVMQCDLKALGIGNFGALQLRGFGRPNNNAALELFFDGRPMILARWPNANWAKIAAAPQGNDGPLFVVEDDRLARWTQAEDLWLHGLWYHDWADSYVKVARLDPATRTVHTEAPHGVYGYRAGQRYYALNLIEELDAPGEYWLDRESGRLYFWPPKPLADAEVLVSILDEPLIAIRDARHLSIEGLTLEVVRGEALTVRNSHHVRIAGCTVRNTGRHGIVVEGGADNVIRSCDLYHLGELGIRLNGGNRSTLEPGRHLASNNHLHHFSRAVITYRPAISLGGVGNAIEHNLIHDAPHAAVLFSGNDHRLEFNEVHNVCRETGDVGVFYIGRDWTMRGHLVRHNFFHDIFGPVSWGAKSVYLDDAASGVSIVGNIFYRSHEGAFIGGGRDNLVENNLFIGSNPAVHVDARGLTFHRQHIVEGGSWNMYGKLRNVRHDQPPYSEAYPELRTLLEGYPARPAGNRVVRNASFGGRWLRLQNVPEDWVKFADNYVSENESEVDWIATGFQLPEGHPALKQGFQPIPVERIGLQPDEFRRTLR
jgi:parallel beta-helix repeat protein